MRLLKHDRSRVQIGEWEIRRASCVTQVEMSHRGAIESKRKDEDISAEGAVLLFTADRQLLKSY